jgi:hypothetical protein
MTIWAKLGFRLTVARLTLSATSALSLSLVPCSVHATLVDPNWHRAIEEEFAALIANNTGDLVPRPVGSNIVTGKWIFKHKFNSDSSLERYKARWVLRGFTQWPNVDYDETFNPIVKPAMVRMMLFMVVSCSWPVNQLDVNNAFLYGTLSETVYYNRPTGFVDPAQINRVCLLNKSLYGLKQAPRVWYSRFATYITSLEFVEAKCVFIRLTPRHIYNILVTLRWWHCPHYIHRNTYAAHHICPQAEIRNEGSQTPITF